MEPNIYRKISIDGYLLHQGGITHGDWVYNINSCCYIPSGIHKASIVLESSSPL